MKSIKYKEINLEEHKKLLVEILKYIDKICRENQIKYTLVGGSLIGAIRHKGIIPWDDDIDIGLLPEEYDKLINCLKNSSNNRYKLFNIDTEDSYWYPFAKVIDTQTICIEKNTKRINNYGIYIDIFKYNYIPSDTNIINDYYNKLQKKINKIFKTVTIYHKNYFKSVCFNILAKITPIGVTRKFTRDCIDFSEQYNGNNNCEYVMSNCTPYGASKETHKISNFSNYIDTDFEGIKVMIIKDYDEVLKRVFNDYMTPPPKDMQITHHFMKTYWKEEHEE